MALFDYLQKAQLLLGDPNLAKFNRFDLITYCNVARSQIAGEGECTRQLGTLSTVANQQQYTFSSISFAAQGVAGALNVRMANVAVGTGAVQLVDRGWEWFNSYYVATPVPSTGQPTIWAQYGQGASGSLFLYPVPNAVYSLTLDTVVLPAALALDTDPEILPAPWTDAVPYFIAYQALLTTGNAGMAQSMYSLFENFMIRARRMSTKTVLPAQMEGFAGAMLAGSAQGVVGQQSGIRGEAQRRGQSMDLSGR